MGWDEERVYVTYAWHSIGASIAEEWCHMCGDPATHKIADQDVPPGLHELRTYLCCMHMELAGMNCRRYAELGPEPDHHEAAEGDQDDEDQGDAPPLR